MNPNVKIYLRQWRGMIVGGVGVLCALVAFTSCTKDESTEPKAKKTPTTHLTVAPTDADMGRAQALYNDRLIKLEKENREAKSREAKLENDKRRLEERLVSIEKSLKSKQASASKVQESPDGWPPSDVLGKVPAASNSNRKGFASGNSMNAPARRYASDGGSATPSERVPMLVIHDFNAPSQNPNSALGSIGPSADKSKTLTYLPSGTFARVRLLNGATAPTRGQGSGNPVPMLMELTDNAVMPNLYRSGIKRCFITGHATGELASERVLVRLDRLSCIDANGGAVDKKIQGYVAGEDGKTGLRAKLVTKSGQAIANALFTGTLSGFGKAVSLSAENQTTSITGTVSTSVTNPWKAGFGEGTSHAMDRITDYYLKLASDMFPVLEVDSGREVDIVISNGLSIDRIN